MRCVQYALVPLGGSEEIWFIEAPTRTRSLSPAAHGHHGPGAASLGYASLRASCAGLNSDLGVFGNDQNDNRRKHIETR